MPICDHTGSRVGSDGCLCCVRFGCEGYKIAKRRKKAEKESRRQFLKEFVHYWRETHEPHRLTNDELWQKAGTREPITWEDLGLHSRPSGGLEPMQYLISLLKKNVEKER